MIDALKPVLSQLRGMWRYRWVALATAWVLALLGWVGVTLIPNVYESHARIYVDTETVLKPLLTGLAVGTDVATQATMMSRVMLSRPNLERVARETDLFLRAKTPQELEDLIAGLQKRILIVSSSADRNLYTISFSDTDPAMSQRVVQTVLSAFVEDTLGIKRADSSEAQRFLEEQIREYEARLRAAEERLADFKRRHVGLMPGEAGGYYERLQAAMQRLEAIETEYRTVMNKRDELLRQLEGEVPTVGLAPGTESAGPATSVDAQIAQYRAQLEALLVRYTEKHPQVIALQETIARLEEQRDAEIASRGPAASPSGVNALNINPVYQSMRIALSQTELQLVELRNRLATERAEVARLRSMVNTVPEVEAELARLNRDYEVNRAQHQALLQRLESARLSEEAATSKEQSRFRIVEPPIVPLLPSEPNRPILNVMVLLLALGAGVGLALALHLFNPVFTARDELEAAIGLPVLGTVIYAPAPDEAKAYRRQPWMLATGLALLLVAFAVAMSVPMWLPALTAAVQGG